MGAQQQQRACMSPPISSPTHRLRHNDATWLSLRGGCKRSSVVGVLARGISERCRLWFPCRTWGPCRAGGRKRADSREAMESLKESQLRHPEKHSK